MAGILLVHGGWHGPWCWDGVAERLTGRGRGPLRRAAGAGRALDWRAGGAEVPGVRPRPGAVLLATFPRRGTLGAVARLAARHPVVLAKATVSLRLRPLVASRALVRELFFAPTTPKALVEEVWGRLQDESYLAFLDTMVVWARPRRVRVPVLVLGAARDGFFAVGETRRLAAAYQTQAEIYAGMGHNLMLDPAWQKVADRIDTWIRELPIPDRPGSPPPASGRRPDL